MTAWSPLGLSEYGAVWDRFERAFRFRPSVYPADFPGIVEPSPSVTFALPYEGGQKRHPTAGEDDDLELSLLAAFRACTPPGNRIYALDWQHESYWLDPHGNVGGWSISAFPDGDYSVFLAPDFSWGVFGHPWEWTMCVFGAPLLAALQDRPPLLFGAPIRHRT